MQFQVLVVISLDTTDITGMVEHMMTPYDADRPVLPYRVDITEEEMALITQHFGVPSTTSRLLEVCSQWCGYQCYQDEQGYYYLSSDNPKGYWDARLLQDMQTDVFHLPDIPLNSIDPLAIITPDGLWHEMPYRWDESEQETMQRQDLVQQLLAQYTGYAAVSLDCHI
ncbi:MAG TPA: hypothetical protein VH593_00755 [Ktedonobacteraceae bacterium]|jgi:hypothetical protein